MNDIELTPVERKQVEAILARWKQEPEPVATRKPGRLPVGPTENELLWGYGRRLAEEAQKASDAGNGQLTT